MANEWSQELLNEINRAGQEFEEAALSGNPRIPDNVRQQVAENVLYRYYQQQQAEREANRGRTVHSYLRDSVYNNVVNPVEYSSEELTAARNRVAELQEQVNRLTAAHNSPYVSEAYKSQNKAELENKQSALALAQQQQERMERDTARARQATQRKVVDEAAERGVSYKDQYDAYSQTLDRLNKDREALLTDRSRIKNGAGYYGAAATYEEDKARQEADEKENSDRLEKLTREIERLEGQRAYAENFLTKDAGAKQIIKQGEELARIAHANKQQNEINALDEHDSDAGFRAAVAFRQAERSGLSPDDRWTQEQKDLYHYYWGAYGQDAAEGFAERVNRYLNGEEAAAGNGVLPGTYLAQKWAERGGKWETAWKSLAVLGGKLGVNNLVYNAASYIDHMLNVAATGRDAGRSFALPNEIVDAASRGVTNRLNETQIVGGKGLGDLYQLGISVAQSIVYGKGIGRIGILGAFFFQAASSSYDQAIQRGASAQYAAAYSTLCGISEGAWETFSFDKLMKGDWTNHFFRTLVTQGLIEGDEEVNTSLFNKYAETLAARLTNEQPLFEREISRLVADGMSRKDAEHQIWTKFAEDVAWDFVGGAISGFAHSGIHAGVQQTQNKLWEMRKDSVLGKENAEGQREGGKKNASNDELSKMFDRALKRGDIRGAEQILQVIEQRGATTEEQEYGPADPTANERMRKRLERQLNGESLNPETENAEAVEESATNRQLVEEARVQAEFPTISPITMELVRRLDGKDFVTMAKSMTTQELAEVARYARYIGENAKADLLEQIRLNPTYRYEEQTPAHTDEDDLLQNGPQNATGQQAAPAGQITQPIQQNAAQTVKPVDSATAENKLFNVTQNPNGVSTRSTESGTMSVPNTQEVTTNAGEQAVQQSEAAAAGESDAGRPVRESGERASDGLLGSQRAHEERVPGQQSRESEADEGTPSFVTEQDLKTLPSENEVRPLTPQQKSSFKDALKDTNDGTEAVTRPKLGSRLHFVQNFLTKIGVDQDVLFATNRSGSVFKDERKGTHNSGKAIISADIDGLDLLPTAIHEVSHKKFFEKFGGMAAKDVINGSYKRRMSVFTKAFMDAFDPMRALNIMNEAQNLVSKGYAYEKRYAKERGGRVSAINKELARTGRYLGTDAKALVQEMEKARSLEEFANELIAWDDVFLEAVNDKLGLSYEDIANLRGKLLSALEGEGAVTPEYIAAINDAVQEWQDLDGEFTDDELEDFPDFGLSGDLFGDIADSDASNFGNNDERRKELGAALRALISGDTEAIRRLSDDALNYAINYTLKQADPDLDFKEKRRSYNVIANILSGENLSRSGLRRDADSNLISPQFGTADSIMQKGGGRRNQLYDFVSTGKLRDVHSDEYVSREHVSNEGKEFGRYQTISTDEEWATNRERAVLINAINELDRRGLNIWGNEQTQGESGTTDDFEKKEKTWWEEPEFSETDRYDQLAGDYSDEVDEDIGRYEKTQAAKDLKRMREGDNWLQGAVKVDPEAKEWGRGAKKTAGQKTQGWYDINRRSSLSEREFARQRVMNARAAEDLSFEIQTMEDQAADIREEVELARRNSPAAKESLKMIDGLLEDLNSDIDDLHAIDDMFRDAVREDPNSDMTKQLAAEGTRLASEIESLRRDIDTLGRLANESIGNNNSEELRDAEKRLKKQEQKIKTKREHLQELLDKSRGGNTSGALVASRAETAFDSMPDDVIKQIIRNGYVSMDMLQDYYGNADAAYQTMYEFQERVGETGKTRVPSVHKLTSLEKTALHGILADRKNSNKITSGYGGVEINENLPEPAKGQVEPDIIDDGYDIESARDVARRAEAGEFDINGSKSTKNKPSTTQPATSDAIRNRNLKAYQNAMAPAGMVYEPSSGPVAANMDRLNRMFADRLGIENKGTTAGAIGTPKSFYDSDASDFGTNKGQKKKPLIVDAEAADFGEPTRGMGTGYVGMQRSRNKDGSLEFRTMYDDALPTRPATDKTRKPLNAPSTAYSSVAQAARSILNSKNSFLDFSKDRPKDIPSKVTNTMGQLREHVREMMEGDHPVNALMQLSNMVHEFENDDDLKVFSSDSIKKAVDELNDIYYNQDITNEEKARRMVENATKTLTLISKRVQLVDRGYNMLKTFTGPRKKRDNTTLWSKYKAMQLNPSTLFKAMDGFARDKNGSGYQIAKMIENGTALYTITQAQALKKLSDVSGLEGFKEFAEGNAKPFDIDGVKITEQQAVEFIMQVRNLQNTNVTGKDGPTTRLNTIDGFSIKDKDGNNTFIERSDDADGTNAEWFQTLAEAMENSLSPAAKKYLETATEILDDLGQQASDIRTNLIGTGFDNSINGTYYPINYDNKNGTSDSQQNKPTSLFSGPMYQSRTRNVGGYVSIKNASDTMDKYIHWASNAIGYGEVAELLYAMDNTGSRMQNLSSLANDTLGQGYSEYIAKYIKDINEIPDGQKNDKSAFAVLRRNMAAGALLGNLGVAAKQAASLWSAAGVLSPQALLSAETYFGGHSGAGNMILQSRMTGTSLDPTISEILHNDSFMGKLMKRSGVSEAMGKATAFVDYQTVKRLFAATVVDTKLSFPGLDQNSELFAQTVEAKFQDVVLQTQPIFVKNARAGYLRANDELTKAFAMFRTQPTQNLNSIVTAMGEYRALKGTEFGKAAGKKLRNTIIGQTASAVTFATLSAIVGFARHGLKKYRDDDDEISFAEVAKRIGLDSLESLAGISVVGGDIAKAIIDMATGGDTKEFYDMNAGVLTMLFDTVSSVTTFGSNVVKAIKDDKPLAVFNAGRQAADNLLQLGGGIPANTVYRLLNSITMYSADALRALTGGKLGNRAEYDDALKMLDSYIKGDLTEEGAKTQAAKAFRKDQPENLLYNLGILSSLTKEDEQDKGRNYLDSLIKKSGDSDAEESKNHRIVDYLVHQSVSADKIDKAIDQYGTSYQYNQFYDILRQNGHSPIQAVKKLDEIDVDGDNKITTDELQDYWKQHGHDPKENKLVEALFGPTADDFRIIKDTKTYETATRYYKPVVDSGVTAEKAVEIVDGCRSDSGDVTQAGIYQYYLAHPEDIKQIQALYNSMGYKENGKPRTWESFLKYQAKQAAKKAS